MKFLIITVLIAIVAVATASDEERPACFCTREMAPVCASNGVTYPNKCEFNCVKKQLVTRGDIDLKLTRGGPCDGPEIPEFLEELF